MINKNKRGAHVGMILSFLVFITFIGFLYSVIEPATKSNEDKLNLIAYLKVELLKEFSSDMSTVTIKIPSDPSESCIEFAMPDPELEGMESVVKNLAGDIFPSFADASKTKIGFSETGVLKIYYSKEFAKGTPLSDCETLIEGNTYTISLFKTDEEIFGSKIINISAEISNPADYEKLKDKLGLSLGDEFGFVFSDENKEFIAGTEEKEVSADIFVEEIPIQYIDSEANIKPGFLNIKVW